MTVELGLVASGRVGSGRVGSGRVGSGRVGSGRVGSGRVRTGYQLVMKVAQLLIQTAVATPRCCATGMLQLACLSAVAEKTRRYPTICAVHNAANLYS